MYAIVGTSNPLRADKELIERIRLLLDGDLIVSELLESENEKSKAEEINRLFASNKKYIFDISGGDLANGVLEYLDYDLISSSSTVFCGYSDVTTILNGIYAKTGKSSWYYQIRYCTDYPEILQDVLSGNSKLMVKFVRGSVMSGVVVGGNLRCFLKLAGTEYFPNLKKKLLVLEANSGDKYKVRTMLNQLKQLGAFELADGIVIGRFTELDRSHDREWLIETILNMTDKPVANTDEIGHHKNSKGIIIGGFYEFNEEIL